MSIGKMCNYCHRIVEVGKICKCRNTKRYKEKKTDETYIDKRWNKVREKCKSNCFGLDVFAYYHDNKIEFGFTVHHIYPVDEFPERKYDVSNLIYLTEQNHRLVHNMMKIDFAGTVKMLTEYSNRFETEFKAGVGKNVF